MLSEEPFLLEAFSAVWARERQLSKMSFLVRDKVRILSKAFPTRRTQKWLLPDVHLHVTEEAALPRKGITALGAHKHFLTRVGLKMNRKVGLLPVSFAALGARERALVGVRLLMSS